MLINSIQTAPHSSETLLHQVYCPPRQAPDQPPRLFVFPQCGEILSYLWWDGRCSSQLCRKDTGNQKVQFVL